MFRCEVCKAVYPDSWPQPIRCSHTQPGKDYRPKAKPAIAKADATAKPNPWQLIHSHLADCIKSGEPWNPAKQIYWYNANFIPLIPREGCGCEDHWAPIAKKLDWSSAEAAFKSFWIAHNEVSEKHAKRPTVTYDYCRALYLPQPSMNDCCIATTSLSPRRLDRQTVCLDSWKQFGLTIHCVQTASEIEQLKPLYPMVDHWHEAQDSPPTIKQLASIACVLDATALLINADIELRGEQRIVRDAVADGVLIGIRHNYVSEWWKGKPEAWGIDAFSFTPEDALKLPDPGFQLGKPVWDYWALDYFRSHKLNWICEPLLFHKKHELAWTSEEFTAGFERLKGTDSSIDLPYGKDFRKSFPYP